MKQDHLLKTILLFHERAVMAYEGGAALADIFAAPVRERIARAKYLTEQEMGVFSEISSDIETQLVAEGVEEGVAR